VLGDVVTANSCVVGEQEGTLLYVSGSAAKVSCSNQSNTFILATQVQHLLTLPCALQQPVVSGHSMRHFGISGVVLLTVLLIRKFNVIYFYCLSRGSVSKPNHMLFVLSKQACLFGLDATSALASSYLLVGDLHIEFSG